MHVLGAGLWVGALVPLVLLLRASSLEGGGAAHPYAVRAARRFSRAALVTMLLLMGSGVSSATAQVESIAGLAGTTYGRLLLAKLAVLAPILLLAAVNRAWVLPALSGSSDVGRNSVMRRLAAFVGLEAGLALGLLALAAAMTVTTPARHADPVWPLPFRLSLDALLDAPAARRRVLLGGPLALAGLAMLAASLFVRRRRVPVLAGALALAAIGAGVGLPPLAVDAYPTTYRRPLVTYHAGSIAEGMTTYRAQCAACHGATGAGHGTTGGTARSSRALLHRGGAPASSSGWSLTAFPSTACRRSRAASERPSAGMSSTSSERSTRPIGRAGSVARWNPTAPGWSRRISPSRSGC